MIVVLIIEYKSLFSCRSGKCRLRSYGNQKSRLRLEVPLGIELPALPGIIGVEQQGRLAVATANAFVPDLAQAYESTGAHVQRVENMTLEEIFIANVERSREEVEA